MKQVLTIATIAFLYALMPQAARAQISDEALAGTVMYGAQPAPSHAKPAPSAQKGDRKPAGYSVYFSDAPETDIAGAVIKVLSAATFREKVMRYDKAKRQWVFKGNRPVVIDFYTPWCGPCKVNAPILEEVAHEHAEKVDFYKINADQYRELAADLGINVFPTYLFLSAEGSNIKRTGKMVKAQFEEAIHQIIASPAVAMQ